MAWPKGKKRSPEFCAAAAERMRKRNTDPDFRAKVSAASREYQNRPEVAAARYKRLSEASREYNRRPEVRAATSERMRKVWAAFKSASGGSE